MGGESLRAGSSSRRELPAAVRVADCRRAATGGAIGERKLARGSSRLLRELMPLHRHLFQATATLHPYYC